MSRSRPLSLLLVAALAVGVLAGCTDDPEPVATTAPAADGAPCRPDRLPRAIDASDVADADVDGTTVTLVTHDSFAVSDGTFDEFTKQTGITVKVLQTGDAGTLVSQSILTAGKPVADVLYGIDTTFLCRGTRAGLFTPYAPAALADVDDSLEQDPDHLVTPIDVGDVCLNYAKAAYPDPADAPQDLEDLADERFARQFVTENPESSSPGLAFLLATIAEYGPDGWQAYWKRLRANGVEVTSGWEEAYDGSFGAGSGDRSI
ncbi:MAG: thiamine ABC transporter substrate-binding protein, partial [Actinobacteria bacterium]|nr:thiamine ABC transporter substrate-binding protein [Actinomycetota bacterium]